MGSTQEQELSRLQHSEVAAEQVLSPARTNHGGWGHVSQGVLSAWWLLLHKAAH